jgi:hypothetical protein
MRPKISQLGTFKIQESACIADLETNPDVVSGFCTIWIRVRGNTNACRPPKALIITDLGSKRFKILKRCLKIKERD